MTGSLNVTVKVTLVASVSVVPGLVRLMDTTEGSVWSMV